MTVFQRQTAASPVYNSDVWLPLSGEIEMKSRIISSVCAALALVAMTSASVPAWAQKAATSQSVKIGYFNLALVKASYPEAAGSETLRTNAESILRNDVQKGN